MVLPILADFKPRPGDQFRRPGQPLLRPDHQHAVLSRKGTPGLTSCSSPTSRCSRAATRSRAPCPMSIWGIRSAMAGRDYPAVREPDFNAAALRESPEIMETIKQTCAYVLASYLPPTHGRFRKTGRDISSASAKSTTTPTVSSKNSGRN
ncbi:MAG: hypothetical protein MZU95_07990 [Desulfomicrobium escambiense]|nr:hypothetical protein [Desulfomicrobium escambiense]